MIASHLLLLDFISMTPSGFASLGLGYTSFCQLYFLTRTPTIVSKVKPICRHEHHPGDTQRKTNASKDIKSNRWKNDLRQHFVKVGSKVS